MRQNWANSTSSCLDEAFSLFLRSIWSCLLRSMASFISILRRSCSSKRRLALPSASATCLWRTPSSLSLMARSYSIWRSIILWRSFYLSEKRYDSFSFFMRSLAAFFLANSSIFSSSASSYCLLKDWILICSWLAEIRSAFIWTARFWRASSRYFSRSRSSSTWRLISSPSSISSLRVLM